MKKLLVRFFQEYNIAILLIALFIAASIFVPNFTRGRNLANLFVNTATYGIMALGFTLVFIVGGIDLSVGFQASTVAVISVLISNTAGFAAGTSAGIAAGLLTGYINGSIVTRMKITPLIATLATMTALKGITLLLTNNAGVGSTNDTMINLYTVKIIGIQLPVLAFLIMIMAFCVFLRHTGTGMSLYVVGGNEEAGKLAGLNTERLTRLAYTLCGLCCGIVGMLLTSRYGTATYNLAENLDVTAISSCVIGGIKLSGGRGNMLQALLGVMVIQLISNMLILLSVHGSIQTLITGLVVVAVLIVDKFTRFEKKGTLIKFYETRTEK